jgi:uncharacterized cupredoxin-like copper-binding protein
MSRRILALAVAAMLVLSVASVSAMEEDVATAPSGSSDQSAQTISLAASDFLFDPKVLNAKPGQASFVVRNGGVIEHNFSIESGPSSVVGAVNSIPSGSTAQLDVTLTSGIYVFACTLPGHREAGMVGVLSVS